MRILSVLALLFYTNSGIACLCLSEAPFTFCDYLKSEDLTIAFKGEIIKTKEYEEENLYAVYVKINKQYYSNTYLTKVVKLYQRLYFSSCDFSFAPNLKIGDTLHIAMKYQEPVQEIDNPDWWKEWYTELLPSDCNTIVLKQQKGIIMGLIAEDVRESTSTEFDYHLIDNK